MGGAGQTTGKQKRCEAVNHRRVLEKSDQCGLNFLPAAWHGAVFCGQKLRLSSGGVRCGSLIQLVKTCGQTGKTKGEQKAREEPDESGVEGVHAQSIVFFPVFLDGEKRLL